VLYALIESHRLGLAITRGADGLDANPVPFTLDRTRGAHGTLKCHVAKANAQFVSLAEGSEMLVVFQGPETYITPSWYESKKEHGKVVPTWNYVVVNAWGRVTLIDDAGWLTTQINELTAVQEGARPAPWAVSDAPDAFVAAQMKGIIGIEIEIARIEGKWETSQNRPEADRIGVAEGLAVEGHAAMAELVARR
jgi:transcriptional regulator